MPDHDGSGDEGDNDNVPELVDARRGEGDGTGSDSDADADRSTGYEDDAEGPLRKRRIYAAASDPSQPNVLGSDVSGGGWQRSAEQFVADPMLGAATSDVRPLYTVGPNVVGNGNLAVTQSTGADGSRELNCFYNIVVLNQSLSSIDERFHIHEQGLTWGDRHAKHDNPLTLSTVSLPMKMHRINNLGSDEKFEEPGIRRSILSMVTCYPMLGPADAHSGVNARQSDNFNRQSGVPGAASAWKIYGHGEVDVCNLWAKQPGALDAGSQNALVYRNVYDKEAIKHRIDNVEPDDALDAIEELTGRKSYPTMVKVEPITVSRRSDLVADRYRGEDGSLPKIEYIGETLRINTMPAPGLTEIAVEQCLNPGAGGLTPSVKQTLYDLGKLTINLGTNGMRSAGKGVSAPRFSNYAAMSDEDHNELLSARAAAARAGAGVGAGAGAAVAAPAGAAPGVAVRQQPQPPRPNGGSGGSAAAPSLDVKGMSPPGRAVGGGGGATSPPDASAVAESVRRAMQGTDVLTSTHGSGVAAGNKSGRAASASRQKAVAPRPPANEEEDDDE